MTTNGGAAFRAAESLRKREAAREMEDARGLPRERIARELEVTRGTIGRWLGPPRRPVPTREGTPAMADPKAPIGMLPGGGDTRATIGDYELDRTPAPAPKVEMYSHRPVSGHDRDVIEEAREAARKKDAAFWGIS